MSDDSKIENFLKLLKDRDWSFNSAPKPVNMFEIAGFPRRETVASNVLAYFFDPCERHGMGSLWVDALLDVVSDGRLKLTDGESTDDASLSLDEIQNEKGKMDWSVETEVSLGSDTQNRIDVQLLGEKISFAIENKVDANLYNDLKDLLTKVEKNSDTSADTEENKHKSFAIVLHPHNNLEKKATSDAWDQFSQLRDEGKACEVLYDDLFDAVQKNFGEKLFGVEYRSLEVMKMFIENMSEKRKRISMEDENAEVEKFVNQFKGHESEINEFMKSYKKYVDIVKSRFQDVERSMVEKIKADDDLKNIKNIHHWIWHEIDHKGCFEDGCYDFSSLQFGFQVEEYVVLIEIFTTSVFNWFKKENIISKLFYRASTSKSGVKGIKIDNGERFANGLHWDTDTGLTVMNTPEEIANKFVEIIKEVITDARENITSN